MKSSRILAVFVLAALSSSASATEPVAVDRYRSVTVPGLPDLWRPDRAVFVGQSVQALPGQVVKPLPGQMVKALPGQVVKALPGQIVQPLPGQIIRSWPRRIKSPDEPWPAVLAGVGF